MLTDIQNIILGFVLSKTENEQFIGATGLPLRVYKKIQKWATEALFCEGSYIQGWIIKHAAS